MNIIISLSLCVTVLSSGICIGLNHCIYEQNAYFIIDAVCVQRK